MLSTGGTDYMAAEISGLEKEMRNKKKKKKKKQIYVLSKTNSNSSHLTQMPKFNGIEVV